VALYFSPNDTDESAFIQAGNVTGFLGTPDQRRGVFLGGNPLVPTFEPGGFGFFQVKGWEAAYGSSYEEAAANVSARVGKSPVFKCDTADGGELSFNLWESSYADRPFRGFVIAVPEPSTAIIGIAGTVALAFLCRVRMLLVLAVVSLGTQLFGQGQILFHNIGGSAEQKVYIDEWLNPDALAPGGRQFLAALYFSPVDGDESSLTQVGSAAGFLGNPDQRYGVFFGEGQTVPTLQIGGAGFFQVKAWEAIYGSTYEEALVNPSARTGKSPIFIADTADRINATEPVYGLVPNSYPERPFQGFVIAVPEPSITMIGVGGTVALAFLCRVRRRKGPARRSAGASAVST